MAAVLPKPHLEVVDELISAPQAAEGEEIVNLNTEEEDGKAPAAAAPAAAAPAAAPAAPADEDAEIPEQYRGKSRKDLAKMLADSQQLIGRQGSELGDFRKRADMLIQSNLAVLAAGRQPQPAAAAPAAPATPADPAEAATEFFRDPHNAVVKAIAEHPTIKKIQETLGADAAAREASRAQAASERFYTAHPDAGEIMADPEFVGWVKASRIRSQLIQRAHNNFDFDAGDELFGTWKALKGIGKPTPPAPAAGGAAPAGEVSDAARTLAAARKKQALNDVATPTGGATGAAGKAGAKKIFRRADVLKLMEENPERYEALAPEIEKAYAEGRVR